MIAEAKRVCDNLVSLPIERPLCCLMLCPACQSQSVSWPARTLDIRLSVFLHYSLCTSSSPATCKHPFIKQYAG